VPGCGDYAILAALQSFMPELERAQGEHRLHLRHRLRGAVPYYMRRTGCTRSTVVHRRSRRGSRRRGRIYPLGRHGRRRLAVDRGNHLIHALRRNWNIKILMFNNEIYGLTKVSTRDEPAWYETKSTPMGSLDWPFNPLSLAIGAEASFVARAIDTDRAHLTETCEQRRAHRGSAFVESFQNCNIYNDGAFASSAKTRQPDLSRTREADPVRRRPEKGVSSGRTAASRSST